MKKINVILSGGVGSRLWPLSRKSRPKQYLPIFENETLFQKTVVRNRPFCDSLIIVGSKNNYEMSRKDLKSLEINDYLEIVEACPRNTAAAIAFAAFAASPEDVLFVTPSDHLIQIDSNYSESVLKAHELASLGNIVTFGLTPTGPETGFGYIEVEGFDVKNFHEKPDLKTAERFFQSGNYLWNSGMFCFKAGVYLEELERHSLQVYNASYSAFKTMDNGFLNYNNSMDIPSISVDYAVMEKTNKIKVVKSKFNWSDMGSFESIYNYLENTGFKKDSSGNMSIGLKQHIEFLGMENTILVYTDDAVLVLKKENSQKVKEVFERLERENSTLVN